MTSRNVDLNALTAELRALDHPVDRDDAADALRDVTFVLAEGEENLGETIRGSSDDRFDSADDLEREVMNVLPRRAVGDPYQSEGDG